MKKILFSALCALVMWSCEVNEPILSERVPNTPKYVITDKGAYCVLESCADKQYYHIYKNTFVLRRVNGDQYRYFSTNNPDEIFASYGIGDTIALEHAKTDGRVHKNYQVYDNLTDAMNAPYHGEKKPLCKF